MVEFKVPNGSAYRDYIPVSYLRGNRPTEMSNLEKEFFNVA